MASCPGVPPVSHGYGDGCRGRYSAGLGCPCQARAGGTAGAVLGGPPCLGRQCARCVPGGILAGLISDYINGRATTCCVMLILAAPMVRRTSRSRAGSWVHARASHTHPSLRVCSLCMAREEKPGSAQGRGPRLRILEKD